MPEHGYSRRKWSNRIVLSLTGIAAGLAILVLVLIIGYSVVRGASALSLDFLTHAAAPVGQEGGGMRNEILGTLILIALASLLALPVGLLTGIFLAEFAGPRMAASVRFAADILAGVPSIIVGVFAFVIVVRPMLSYSAFAGGVALAIIMIPIVARTTEEAMRLVPNSMREAALALGITRWRAVLSVIVPGALTGVLTGIMVAIARIAGETAPLLFTALGSFWGFKGLLKPVGALPLQIYKYALSPYQDWQQQAWAGSFLLILLVLGISILVRRIGSRRHA
jgi:phosphate transport system permease protein